MSRRQSGIPNGLRSQLSRAQAQVAELEATLARRPLLQQADVFDLAHDAIVICNLEGRILFWNRRAQDLYGWSEQEAIGNMSHVLLSTVFPNGDGKAPELIASNPRWAGEYHQAARDGRALVVANRSSLLLDEQGNPSAVLEVNRDITERKRAETAAHASAEHFRLIVETVEDYALIMLDPGGHVISWNIGAERLKGYHAAEIIGQHFSRFYTPDAIAIGHPDEILRIAVKQGRYTEEGWRVRKDATMFLAKTFVAPIHDDQGKLIGFAKVVHDITEQKKIEESFRLAVEASPSAMIMVGSDGLITMVNTQTEKLFDYDRHGLIGQPIEMLLPVRFRPKHGGFLKAFFAAPDVRPMGEGRELFGLRKNGSEVTVEIGLSPITTSQGRFVLASVMDITARKRIERSLREQALILDMATDAVFIRDSEDRVTYWNLGAERLYGWNRKEAWGRVTHSLLQTRFPQALSEIEAQLLATGQWQGELVHTQRDGTLVTVASSWTLQRAESNRPVSVLEVDHDITSRKQAEDRLNVFAARLSLATQIMRAGIWSWDLRSNQVVWDETMHESMA